MKKLISTLDIGLEIILESGTLEEEAIKVICEASPPYDIIFMDL